MDNIPNPINLWLIFFGIGIGIMIGLSLGALIFTIVDDSHKRFMKWTKKQLKINENNT